MVTLDAWPSTQALIARKRVRLDMLLRAGGKRMTGRKADRHRAQQPSIPPPLRLLRAPLMWKAPVTSADINGAATYTGLGAG
jgi:hypothetical protein